MESYREWKEVGKRLSEIKQAGGLTQEEINIYIKVVKMLYGKAYACLNCPHNDGNFQKGECYNCQVWE